MTTRVEVAVIGGGPAGASAALRLARGGRSVAIFEKHPGPHHKVCGEFISPEGLPYLQALNLDIDKFGATTISRVRLHSRHHRFETALPQAARGLSRFLLDELLLEGASNVGALVHRGAEVRTLRALHGGYELTTATRTALASTVICATGKFDFKPVQIRHGRDSTLVGFKLHLRLRPEPMALLRGHVDLFVFRGGYGGICPVEGGLANLCLLLDRRALGTLGRDWPSQRAHLAAMCPSLAVYMDGSEPSFWPAVTVANVPYGFVRETAVAPNLFCVGDQLAVIPSFAGEGTTIALMSGHFAAEHILRAGRGGVEHGADAFHAAMARHLKPQVRAGFRVHRLFRSPLLTDLGTLAARFWPGLADRIFHSTRSPGLEATADN